jgi:hypothetical protein
MGAPVVRVLIPSKLTRAPFYGLRLQTGALTAVAAATSSAGHIIAVRNTGNAVWRIMRMRLAWLSTVDPSTAQQVGLQVNKLTGYSAAHTGGTAATTGNPYSKSEAGTSTSYAALTAIAHRTAGTDALTAGTQTIGEKLGSIDDIALVAAATVKKTRIEREWVGSDRHPLFSIGLNEGILVRNSVLMANSLAGLAELELDGWLR